ncbi:MAG TPA: chemotaxis protein CheW [Polyangia bacterium]|nr:chemotaxis protein CheW [Polyangia bacterium]
MKPQPPAAPPQPIDWDAARARLSTLARAGDEEVISPAQLHKRLAERARRLAQVVTAPASQTTLPLVRFATDGVEWALSDRWVRGLVRAERLAALPGTPPYVAGVTHQRGDLILVVDLPALLGAAAAAPADDRLLLILGDTRDEVALVVASAVDTDAIAEAELLASPHPLADRDARLVLGVTRDGCTVLDGAALLGDPRLDFGSTRLR